MQEITFNCEVISPLFIGNASTKGCELRPSAIKASMRFWWRAIHPNFSSENLRIKECELFGGSYIPRNNDGKTKNNPPKFRFLEFTTKPNIKDEKIDSRDSKQTKRKAIPPNTVFTITLLCKESDTKKIISLVHLASALGGLGNRSRRGAGAWKITSYTLFNPTISNNDTDIEYTIESILQTIHYLNKDIYTINHETIIIKTEKINTTTNDSGFPYLKEVCIGTAYTNHSTLRAKIMLTAHDLKDENSDTFKKSLGAAVGQRLSSPVIVSIISSSNSQNIKPIVSTVNHTYNERYKTTIDGFQNRFKKAILENDVSAN